MRAFAVCVMTALALIGGAAHAQTTRATLNAYNNQYIIANGQHLITGPILNQSLTNTINGVGVLGDFNAWTSTNQYTVNPSFTNCAYPLVGAGSSPIICRQLLGTDLATGAAIANLGSQSANSILAGPTSGSSSAPTFRALVPADIPTGVPAANSTYKQAGAGGVSLDLQTFSALLTVTPQQFGAKCDGTTDDNPNASGPLQQWLNALGTLSVSSSPVYAGFIPSGTCTFTTPLTRTGINAVSISGAGPGSQLRYIGASTTATPISLGATTGSCSMQSVTLKDFLLSSATKMTAGAAVEFDDVCGLRTQNLLVEDNAGGALGNWAQAFVEKGGNQHYHLNDTLTGSIQPVLIYGDDAAHSSTQLTDPRYIGGIIAGGVVGINIAGNVGGMTMDGVDILSNQTQIKVSQDNVAIPNNQIVLGPSMFVDATNGGLGRGIDIEDAGGNNSILMLRGTWLSSAGTDCLYIASAANNWHISWDGGSMINCGANGINNKSSSVHLNVNDLLVNMTLGGFGGNSGYGVNCANIDANAKFSNINFQSVTGSGNFSIDCRLQTWTQENGSQLYLGAPMANNKTTVAGLANYSCVTANAGQQMAVTDFTGTFTPGSTNFGAGGGTQAILAVCDGSSWAQH